MVPAPDALETLFMKRAGRKRKLDAPRLPGGKIHYNEHRDHGTPQVQARRLFLANGKDTALTTYPLGIMLANEVIDETAHQAGCKLAWLHAILFGKTSITAQNFDTRDRGRSSREHDEQWLIERKREFNDASAALKSLSRQHYDAIISIAVYDRVPGFLKPKLQTGKDVKEGRLTMEGLNVLAQSLGMRSRRVA